MELNLTQSSIYQELGISRKTYSAWENGLAEPHAKNLRRLATCLKVQENYFVDETSALYTYPLLTPPHKKETPVVVSNATAFGPVTDEHTGPVERGDALYAVEPAPAEEEAATS